MKNLFIVVMAVIGLALHALTDPGPFRKGDIRDTTTVPVKVDGRILSSSKGNPYFYDSRWPAVGATHRTSKFAGSVLSNGRMEGFRDNTTNKLNPGFEFPVNSGSDYLWVASLWIGGIVGEDTLVSTGYTADYYDGYFTGWGGEFFPPDDPNGGRGISPSDVGEGATYRAYYVDTFTIDVPNLPNDYFDRPHVPLNLSVLQKSYSLDVNPYRNIMLLDFIITNIGPDPIEKACMGILVDGDVCSEEDNQFSYCWNDDLVGSFHDISTGYIIDNDGDPKNDRFQDRVSPIDGLALRPVMIYPSVTDTNFNWWVTTYWDLEDGVDFGPRLRGIPQDPFRDFLTGGIGAPMGDVNKYYILSHGEWDYDQVMTPTVDSTDSLWLYPDQSNAGDIAKGFDTRFLLSVGPVDLMPDSSMRAVFALFGADFIHIDPLNRFNLLGSNYCTYYDNLQFVILRETAEYAANFARSMIDPMRPPTGLNVVKVSADTAVLSWDPWVFPEVTGYNIYLKPVDDSYLIAPGFVMPGVGPENMGYNVHYISAGRTIGEITGLQPGRLYFAAIAQVTESGEGKLSKPVVVGYDNVALRVKPVHTYGEYVFFTEGDSSVTLSWAPSETSDVRYYRIYKTLDTAVANNRYYPFVTGDSSLVPYAPKVCREAGGVTYCYYEMKPYDSTVSDVAAYTDRYPVDGAIYWVCAIGHPGGYQSPYSDLITTEEIVSPTKEIVVVLGANWTEYDYVYPDSLISYYSRLLSGYDFDIYNWLDTNLLLATCPSRYCTDWRDLARYELVIVEEFPAPKILCRKTEPAHKLLTRILDSGRDLVYFGTPSGNELLDLSSDVDTIIYESNSFEARYFDLDSAFLKSWDRNYRTFNAVDSLAGFNGAVPATDELPQLFLDSTNNRLKREIQELFIVENDLPHTPTFRSNQDAEVLYLYHSRYPNTSELQGMPCGLLSRCESSKAYVFSFHLWAIEETAARQLIDYIMEHRTDDSSNNSPLLPTSVRLYQNFPNPFNLVTKISFDLPPNLSRVTLEIYNILGQRVRTLLDEIRPAGSYTVAWNSRNDHGETVASGIYFYLLKAGDMTIAKKMVLLK